MDAATCRFRVRHVLGLAVLSAVLAGCGGGGGDDGQLPPLGDVDLTAANQESAVRAAAVAMQGGVVVTATGLTGGGSDGGAGVATLLQHVSRAIAAGQSMPRKQPAALVDVGFLFFCASGLITATLDDRDNSLAVTPGDVLTASFVNCQVDGASDELLNGSMTATYTAAAQSPLTVGATVVVSNLADSSQQSGRSVSLNGGFTLSYVEPNASTSTTQISVPNALSVQVVHPLYQDSVGLQPGYTLRLYYDMATPPGASSGGRTTIEVAGKISSARAGGIFDAWSQPPGFELWDVDRYPRSGQMLLQGRNGRIMVTVQSNTTVRLELDANGDTVYESSQDLPWDSLL